MRPHVVAIRLTNDQWTALQPEPVEAMRRLVEIQTGLITPPKAKPGPKPMSASAKDAIRQARNRKRRTGRPPGRPKRPKNTP